MTENLHVVCPHCATVNRLPAKRLEQSPNCGQCKRPLFVGEPVALTAASFDRHIGRSDLPVVVDFWAPWCGPCRTMTPTFQQAAGELEPRLRLAKLDTEAEPELAARHPDSQHSDIYFVSERPRNRPPQRGSRPRHAETLTTTAFPVVSTFPPWSR